METEEILKLPDFTVIKENFTGKYKDDIIVKGEHVHIPGALSEYSYINVYVLYKLNDKYLHVAGRVTSDYIEDFGDTVFVDLANEYENLMEEYIEVESFTISDILNFNIYVEAENELTSKFKNGILITYKDYRLGKSGNIVRGMTYRYVYYLYGTQTKFTKHMSGFMLERLEKENFLHEHITKNEEILVNMINKQINN